MWNYKLRNGLRSADPISRHNITWKTKVNYSVLGIQGEHDSIRSVY